MRINELIETLDSLSDDMIEINTATGYAIDDNPEIEIAIGKRRLKIGGFVAVPSANVIVIKDAEAVEETRKVDKAIKDLIESPEPGEKLH